MAIRTNRPGIHKVKVEGTSEETAAVFIDEMRVRASKVDVHMEVGCMHQTDIRLCGEPEMEYESLVTFDFDPKTVRKAVDVLKIALERNDFIARMGLDQLNKVMEK